MRLEFPPQLAKLNPHLEKRSFSGFLLRIQVQMFPIVKIENFNSKIRIFSLFSLEMLYSTILPLVLTHIFVNGPKYGKSRGCLYRCQKLKMGDY